MKSIDSRMAARRDRITSAFTLKGPFLLVCPRSRWLETLHDRFDQGTIDSGRRFMRWLAGVCLFMIGICFPALGQRRTVPANWTGTWKLNVGKSTFGTVLFPGVPADFRILSRTLRIDQAANEIRLSGDATASAGGVSDTGHDDTTLRFDGTPTKGGPVSLSFRRIDNSAFEVIGTFDDPRTNLGEVSRFVFSSDGSKPTATKIQTERAPVPVGTDKSKGAVIRTSTFILVYDKAPEHE